MRDSEPVRELLEDESGIEVRPTGGGGERMPSSRLAANQATGALIAVRFSGRVREQVVDAIAGWQAPFVIDGHCELACACDLHPPETPALLLAFAPASTMSRHCVRCAA